MQQSKFHNILRFNYRLWLDALFSELSWVMVATPQPWGVWEVTPPSRTSRKSVCYLTLYAHAIANAMQFLFRNDHIPFQPLFQLIKCYQ